MNAKHDEFVVELVSRDAIPRSRSKWQGIYDAIHKNSVALENGEVLRFELQDIGRRNLVVYAICDAMERGKIPRDLHLRCDGPALFVFVGQNE